MITSNEKSIFLVLLLFDHSHINKSKELSTMILVFPIPTRMYQNNFKKKYRLSIDGILRFNPQ